MIEKTQLLPNDGVEFNIQILPDIPTCRVVYETEIALFPQKKSHISWGDAKQEILYCLENQGTVRSTHAAENIERRVRPILKDVQDCVVENNGPSDLRLIRYGIDL